MVFEGYTGRTVLITGSAGFIGSALVNALSGISCRIVLLLRTGRSWAPITNTAAKIVCVHGDIQESQTWAKALDGVDYVFHFAAQTSSQAANRNPLADLDANVVPVIQMLEACRQGGLNPAILFSGTATQVGLTPHLPIDENVRDLPITVYDIHKLAGEKYLQYFASEAGITTATLRLANVYGPGPNVGRSDRGVLNLMIKKGLNNEVLTVYGDGAWVRDYIFIDDVVSAFLTAGTLASELSGNYYLIGSGQGSRIVDAFNLVADRVNLKMGFRPDVIHVPPPDSLSPIEERDFVADSGLFRTATGWAPRVSLEDGIERTIEYLLAQREAFSKG